MIALTTQRHVSILTADDHLLVVRAIPTVGEGCRRPVRTALAKGCESFHSIGERNTLKKLSKRPPIRISVEPDKIQVLSEGIHDPLDKGNESTEKLGLVENDDVEANNVFCNESIEVSNGNTWGPLTVMGCDFIATIPRVVCVLDDKHRRSECSIARNQTQNTGGFARKHGSDENVEGHLRPKGSQQVNGL